MEYELKVLKINDNKIKQLNELSLYTVKDLILHYPYRYEEMLETPLHDETKVIIEGKLIDEPKVFFKGRLSRLTFHIDYHGETLTITLFNRHFLKKNMHVGMKLTIVGKYNEARKSITASEVKLKGLEEISGITPVYSLKEGLTQKSFQGYVNKALSFYKGHIGNSIPDYLCQKYHLVDRQEALFKVHQPQTRSDVISALRYLKYEEFFKFQMTMQYIKQNRTQNIGISKLIDKEQINKFIQKLPFQLTEDQQKVVDDILIDLSSQKLMYRFVQGDVGSGKTVVAAISLYANYLAGYQGAMMAPTEILALQHYQSLKKLFKKTKVNIALLTGHLSLKEKNDALYNAVIVLADNPSNSAFETACDAWITAREPWEKSEAFLFGPVDEMGLDPNMDSWPLDQNAIVQILNSQSWSDLEWSEGDDEAAVESAQNVRGFHTLEFLLYKNGEPRKVQ